MENYVLRELITQQESCDFCSFVKNELNSDHYSDIPFEVSNTGTLFYNLDKTSSGRRLVITNLGVDIYYFYRHIFGHLELVDIVDEMKTLFFHENIKKAVLSCIKKCRACCIINVNFIRNEKSRKRFAYG